MTYPLVTDLADEGVPVAVTCRVLGFSKQAYFKWRAKPVCDRDLSDAYLIDAAFDAHHDDPTFGYRFISDELELLGFVASENWVQRLCSMQKIWSIHAKKRGMNRRPGPPVHDDLVNRDFTAPAANVLWLTDITEHPTTWIPAVVATPLGGDGDGWSEVQQETEGAVLRSDRQRWNGRAAARSADVHPGAAYTWLRNAGLTMQRATPRIYSAAEKAEFFRVSSGVKRWRDPAMVRRWVGTGMIEAQRSFQRIKGCKDMGRRRRRPCRSGSTSR